MASSRSFPTLDQHIKRLDANKDLCLKQLSMKIAMLLVLTRPSHSVDLSKLEFANENFSG